MRSPTRWLAWLCLSLMLWAAMAESTHHHANQTEASSCPICVVAHSTAPAPSPHQCRPVFATVDVLAEEEFTAKAQLGVFELGIRGPPEA
jgi:hypothetical protein